MASDIKTLENYLLTAKMGSLHDLMTLGPPAFDINSVFNCDEKGVTQRSLFGHNLMSICALNGDFKKVELLFSWGANAHTHYSTLFFPNLLVNLCEKPIEPCYVQVLQSILTHDPSAFGLPLDTDGYNPLMCAANNQRDPFIGVLLKNSTVLSHLNDVDAEGISALEYAVNSKALSIVDDLLIAGAQFPSNDPFFKRRINLMKSRRQQEFYQDFVSPFESLMQAYELKSLLGTQRIQNDANPLRI